MLKLDAQEIAYSYLAETNTSIRTRFRVLIKFRRLHLSPEVSPFTKDFSFHQSFHFSSRVRFSPGLSLVFRHLHKMISTSNHSSETINEKVSQAEKSSGLVTKNDQTFIKDYLITCNYQEIFKIYQDLIDKRVKIHPVIVIYVFAAYIKVNDLEGAKILLNKSHLGNFHINTFLKILTHYLKKPEEMDFARTILQNYLVERVNPNSPQFSVHVSKLFNIGKIQQAYVLYNNIICGGINPNEHTYNVFLSGFLAHDNYTYSVQVWNDMKKKGHKPTSIIYSTMINGFARKKKYHDAEVIWEQMKRENIKPDSIAYCAMLDVYFRAKDYQKALRIFEKMRQDNIPMTEIVFNRIINGLLWNNRVDEAISIYRQMHTMNVRPCISTFNILIRGLLYYKKYETLIAEILNDMRMQKIAPDVVTLTTLIERYFAKGDLDSVGRVINSFPTYGIKPNVATYGALISGLMLMGDYPAAKLAYEEMLSANILPNIQIYGCMLNVFFKLNDLQNVNQIHRNVKRDKIRPTIAFYNILIGGYVRAGNFLQAKNCYHEMKHLNVYPNQNTYKTFFICFISFICRFLIWRNTTRISSDLVRWSHHLFSSLLDKLRHNHS